MNNGYYDGRTFRLNDCDGSGPCVVSEVRVLPLGSNPHHGNLILCRACFEREIAFRRERNRELARANWFALPAWDSLAKYL